MDFNIKNVRLEINYETQKRMLLVISFLVFIVCIMVTYIFVEQREYKARMDERKEIELKHYQREDSLKTVYIDRLNLIIHKLDSINYVHYLDDITNPKKKK